MTIEYIELKQDQPNLFWNDTKPTLYLDESLCVKLPEEALYNYTNTNNMIKKHGRYCLNTLNKQNLVLEFMPFASRKLRDHLNSKNNKSSKVPLITWYNNSYIIYISHNEQTALLKIDNEDIDNEFLDIIDRLYEIS